MNGWDLKYTFSGSTADTSDNYWLEKHAFEADNWLYFFWAHFELAIEQQFPDQVTMATEVPTASYVIVIHYSVIIFICYTVGIKKCAKNNLIKNSEEPFYVINWYYM